MEVWTIGVIYFLADKLGYLPPRADMIARLNQPAFNVVGHILVLWQIIAMIAYSLLFVLIIRLLINWPWFRRGFEQPAEEESEPPAEQPAPQNIDARYRVEIPDARPTYPQPEPTPARPSNVDPLPRTAAPTPPPPKPAPKPAAAPRQATPTPPTSAPPRPKPRQKIPGTSKAWLALHPTARARIERKRQEQPKTTQPIIELPAAKPQPDPPTMYHRPRRPYTPRPKPPGATKTKRKGKYQPTEED